MTCIYQTKSPAADARRSAAKRTAAATAASLLALWAAEQHAPDRLPPYLAGGVVALAAVRVAAAWSAYRRAARLDG